MRGCSDDEADLVRLVSRPYVVDVLDTLVGRPMTHRELCRVLRAFRRPITEAIRALAGHGILELLQHIAVWEAIYERYLHSHPEAGQVKRSGRDGR